MENKPEYWETFDELENKVINFDILTKLINHVYKKCLVKINKEWKHGNLHYKKQDFIEVWCTSYSRGYMAFFVKLSNNIYKGEAKGAIFNYSFEKTDDDVIITNDEKFNILFDLIVHHIIENKNINLNKYYIHHIRKINNIENFVSFEIFDEEIYKESDEIILTNPPNIRQISNLMININDLFYIKHYEDC